VLCVRLDDPVASWAYPRRLLRERGDALQGRARQLLGEEEVWTDSS
jgi:hypothetical protein